MNFMFYKLSGSEARLVFETLKNKIKEAGFTYPCPLNVEEQELYSGLANFLGEDTLEEKEN